MQTTITGTNAKASQINRRNIRQGNGAQQFQSVRFTGYEKKATTATFSNRLLALNLKPITSLDAHQRLGFNLPTEIKSHLKGLLNDCRAFIGKIPNGTIPDYSELLNTTLIAISKETKCEYSIEKHPNEDEAEKYLIVFYRECDTYNNWYAPRLAFLRKLEKENRQWFGAALDAVRYIKNCLNIGIAHESSYATDYLLERLDDLNDFEKTERKQLKALLKSYEQGKIKELFTLIEQEPILGLSELEQLIETLPDYPFKQPLLSALSLCGIDKNIVQYDFCPNSDRLDEDCEPLTLYNQYSWIYDFDKVVDEICEENQNIYNEYGCEVPYTSFVLSNYSHLSKEEIITKIRETVIEDTYVDNLNLTFKNLCESIAQFLDNELT